MQNSVETQTESVDITVINIEEERSKPISECLYDIRVELNKSDVDVVKQFNLVRTIFLTLKNEAQAFAELQQCIEVSLLCIQKLNKKDKHSYVISREIIKMATYLLELMEAEGVFGHERDVLTTLMDIVDQYSESLAPGSQDSLKALIQKDSILSRTSQTTQTFFKQNAPSIVEMTSDQSVMPQAIDYENLLEAFNQLRGSNKKSKWNKLHDDMWCYVRCLIECNTRTRSYDVTDEVIYGLELALSIQKAYMGHLVNSQAHINKQVSEFQAASQLMRYYRDYYCLLDGISAELKQNCIHNAHTMQLASLNVLKLKVCFTVTSCSQVTDSERHAVIEQGELYYRRHTADVSALFASYTEQIQHVMAIPVDDYSQLSPKVITQRLNHRLTTQEELSDLSTLMHDASIFLTRELGRLFPQCFVDESELLRCADNDQLYTPSYPLNFDSLGTVLSERTQKLDLLRAFEIYYKAKIKHLKVYEKHIPKDDELLREHLNRSLFISEFRQDVYRFLLLDAPNSNMELLRKNYDEILASGDDSSFLTRLIVQYKMQHMVQEAPLEVATTVDSAQNIPTEDSSVPLKTEVKFSEKKTKAKQNQTTIWKELVQKYSANHQLPTIQGWLPCKKQLNDFMLQKKYDVAYYAVKQWFDWASKLGRTDDIAKMSLFEAKFCLVVISKMRQNYDQALEFMDELSSFCISSETYETVAYYQKQNVLCEKALIHAATSADNDLVKQLFDLAKQHAREHHKISYAAVLYEIKDISLTEEILHDYKEVIEDLGRHSAQSIDEYTLSYMYRVHCKFATAYYQIGIKEFEEKQTNHVLGYQYKSSADKISFVKKAIQIYETLLECGIKRFSIHEREIYLNLADIYFHLFSLEHHKEYYLNARKYYQSAMCHSALDEITEKAQQKLRQIDTIHAYQGNSKRYLIEKHRERKVREYFEGHKAQISEWYKNIGNHIEDGYASVCDYSQWHYKLGQIKNIVELTRERDFLTNETIDKYETFYNACVLDRAVVDGFIRMLYQAVCEQYDEDPKDKEGLFKQHNLARAYLCHLRNISFTMLNQEAAGMTSERYPFLREWVDEMCAKIATIEDEIFNLDPEAIISPEIPHAPNELQISNAFWQKYFSNQSSYDEFTQIKFLMQKNRYWEACQKILFFIQHGTVEQKSVCHFLIGKLYHWVLNEISSQAFLMIFNIDELRPYVKQMIEDLASKAKSHYKHAKNGMVDDHEVINDELRKLRQQRPPIYYNTLVLYQSQPSTIPEEKSCDQGEVSDSTIEVCGK